MVSKIQEKYLTSVVKNNNPVTVFLLNGIKLQGIITDFDDDVILLRRDSALQVLYKQAISTIMANNPISEVDNEK